MKQFDVMSLIRQGFLGLTICAVMSPSHAISVRERYLLQHPQAATHRESQKTHSAPLVKSSKKYQAVNTNAAVHQKVSLPHRQKTGNTTKKYAVKQPEISHAQQRAAQKHSRSKFDNQQVHDAEAALNHRKNKPEIHRHHQR